MTDKQHMSAAEWRAHLEAHGASGDDAFAILKAWEDDYNEWRGRLDTSEHEGMRWKDRAERVEREVDRLRKTIQKHLEPRSVGNGGTVACYDENLIKALDDEQEQNGSVTDATELAREVGKQAEEMRVDAARVELPASRYKPGLRELQSRINRVNTSSRNEYDLALIQDLHNALKAALNRPAPADGLREALRIGKPWPLELVLNTLCGFAEMMLYERNYDGQGNETLKAAVEAGREIENAIPALSAPAAPVREDTWKSVAQFIARFVWERDEGTTVPDSEFEEDWNALDADQREVYYIASNRILSIFHSPVEEEEPHVADSQ